MMLAPSYIGVVEKEEASDFCVFFPDLPGCVTAGKTLVQAREWATEVLTLHLEGMMNDGDDLPTPRPLAEIVAELNDDENGFSNVLEILNVSPEFAEEAA